MAKLLKFRPKMSEKKPKNDAKKAVLAPIRLKERHAIRLNVLAKSTDKSPTELVNDAVRELLNQNGLWPEMKDKGDFPAWAKKIADENGLDLK